MEKPLQWVLAAWSEFQQLTPLNQLTVGLAVVGTVSAGLLWFMGKIPFKRRGRKARRDKKARGRTNNQLTNTSVSLNLQDPEEISALIQFWRSKASAAQDALNQEKDAHNVTRRKVYQYRAMLVTTEWPSPTNETGSNKNGQEKK